MLTFFPYEERTPCCLHAPSSPPLTKLRRGGGERSCNRSSMKLRAATVAAACWNQRRVCWSNDPRRRSRPFAATVVSFCYNRRENLPHPFTRLGRWQGRFFAAPVICFLLLPARFYATSILGGDARRDCGGDDFCCNCFLPLPARFFATTG